MYFGCPSLNRLLTPHRVVTASRCIGQTVSSADICSYRFLSTLSIRRAYCLVQSLSPQVCRNKGRKLLHTSSARRTPVVKSKVKETQRQIVEATEQKTFSELTVGQKGRPSITYATSQFNILLSASVPKAKSCNYH